MSITNMGVASGVGNMAIGVEFSPQITLGHIVEAAGFILAGLGVIYSTRIDVRTLKVDVTSIKEDMKQFTNILVNIARQDERLTSIDKRIDKLEES